MNKTPESCGVSSRKLERYLRILNQNGYPMHAMLMARGDDVFLDAYWAPFTEKTLHRNNSITKSFVSMAIGLLCEEGKISLTDRIIDWFPEKLPEKVHEYHQTQTIADMLAMETCMPSTGLHWIYDRIPDRIKWYFETKPDHPSGTLFFYDTTGSYLLGALVEKLTGMPFMEYLKEKVLRKIGFSEDTYCIQCQDEGYSWSDSGLMCTAHDLYRVAKLLRNGGAHNGEQLLPKWYVEAAIGEQTNCVCSGLPIMPCDGYGYQIWKAYGGFSFHGMGCQFMFCIPQKDFYFVCNADTQFNESARFILMDRLYYDIVEELSDEPLPEDPEAYRSLQAYCAGLQLTALKSLAEETLQNEINHVRYNLGDNPMNIRWLALHFSKDGGVLEYENAQGRKELEFGLNRNAFTLFPQEGYPDMYASVPCEGHHYPCAVSAAWVQRDKLYIMVQMTGKHLGGLFIRLGFKGDEIGVHMLKNTRCFLREYNGWAGGRRVK